MTEPQSLENRLKALAELVEQLERGDIPLEEALRQYEQGIALVRECQRQLTEAEQTILRLQQNGERETLVPFHEED
ncbi:MAG: exodeoxyribonuclease VII small subunit [Cardiobacteriaceae bacterium]|nr:exodeoxyribonuclease VII small subunit [Cardiobacteriaceae bacterium]